MPRPARTGRVELSERNGVWNIMFYDPITKRTRRIGLRTRSLKEAEGYMAKWLLTPEAERFFRRRKDELTVVDCLEEYFKNHAKVKIADPVRQRNAITRLAEFFAEHFVKDIDIPECRRYMKERRMGRVGKPAADATIRRELNVLKAAVNHARKWKRLPAMDMPSFDLPPDTPVQQDEGWYSKQDIADLIFNAEGWLRDFIILAYYTGARRNSIETLETNQVFLEAGRINLLKRGARVTTKRKPPVPIYPEMVPTLKRLIADAKTTYLFGPTVDFYRPFTQLCERLGLKHKHPHVLRHSRATHMLMDSESIYKVARLLGDSVKTVERVYGHHSIEFLRGEIQ